MALAGGKLHCRHSGLPIVPNSRSASSAVPPPHDSGARFIRNAGAPQQRAIAIRIEREHYCVLGSRHHHALAAGQSAQNRRASDIPIGPHHVRAILRLRLAVAAIQPCIIGLRLIHPQHFARIQIERHHRVRRFLGRLRLRIAGAEVNGMTLRINGRRIPHRGSGGRVELRAFGIFPSRLRLLGNRVSLPDLFTGVGIERRYAAAKSAARVLRRGGLKFLP